MPRNSTKRLRTATEERHQHLVRFYAILDKLERNIGSARMLEDCSGRMKWPKRGVYFFREAGENRTDTGNGPRIVRVGTHVLKAGSGTKLWTRLSQHKGRVRSRGGNHRGSIFRLIVGTALIGRDGYDFPTWGQGNSAAADIRKTEQAMEREVSQIIGRMPFLWLAVNDEPGPESLRGYIERNAIALLSNCDRPSLDLPSQDWLGHFCDREKVQKSGLWNSNHVDEEYDPDCLDQLERVVEVMGRTT